MRCHVFAVGALLLAGTPAFANLIPIPISCGALDLPGMTSGASELNGYLCTALNLSGPEQVYVVVPSVQSWISVRLDGRPELKLLNYDSLQPAPGDYRCVAYGDHAMARPGAKAGNPVYFVVDGENGAAGSFKLSVQCLPSPTVAWIACGATAPVDLAPPSLFDVYRDNASDQKKSDDACDRPRAAGAEALASVTTPAIGHLLVSTDAPFPVEVILAREADSPVAPPSNDVRCQTAGQGGVALWNAAPGVYYAFLEAPEGTTGIAEVTVRCGSRLNCAAPDAVLPCNGSVTGDTRGASNATSLYSCNRRYLTGGERVISFVNPLEQNVWFEFRGSPGQEAYLVPECDEGACRVSADTDRVFFTASHLPAGRYVVVVDEDAGQEGAFTLTARCQGVGGNLRPTRADTSTIVISCAESRVSGTMEVEVTNFGPQAVASGFTVTVFEDADSDDAYDAAIDNRLGSAALPGPVLAPSISTVPVVIAGLLQFAGDRLHVVLQPTAPAEEPYPFDDHLVVAGGACRSRPRARESRPFVKWESQRDCEPDPPWVESFAALGNLNDDNGDGRIDTADIADIVYRTFPAIVPGIAAVRALDGRDGTFLFELCRPDLFTFAPVIADLVGDGTPEVVLLELDVASPLVQYVAAYSNTGAFLWRSPALPEQGGFAAISLADLDSDGKTEIVVGKVVLNSNGSIRWVGSEAAEGGRGTSGLQTSSVADLDGDGSPEVIVGPSAYHADGTVYWSRTDLPDGFTAVADFDGDAIPEVVLTTTVQAGPFKVGGSVFLLERDGTTRWGPVDLPDPLSGIARVAGLPAVADFDGDGRLDIAVSSGGSGNPKFPSFVFLLDDAGRIIWQVPGQDESNEGPSGFDFDDDGVPEIVYGGSNDDAQGLRVLDGRDGRIRYQTIPTLGGDFTYIPPVADLDQDGHADIVAYAKPVTESTAIPWWGNSLGLALWSDFSWPAARQTFNQVSYHVTNVNDDGTIPRTEVDSWKANNTYRVQVGPETRADVTASALRLDRSGCPTVLRLTARIGNGGTRTTGTPVRVAFYAGATPIGTALTTAPLAPGEYEEVSVSWFSPPATPVDLSVLADDDGTGSGSLVECDEGNNACSLGLVVPCSGCLATAAVVPVASVCAGDPVTLDASVSSLTGCSGATEYLFRDGARLLRDWLPDPLHVFALAASVIVTAEVRCSTEAVCRASTDMPVTVKPDVAPASVENTLLATRSGNDIRLEWGPSAGAERYRLRSATEKDFSGSAGLTDPASPAALLSGAVASPPSLVFYRAYGLSCSGREGL